MSTHTQKIAWVVAVMALLALGIVAFGLQGGPVQATDSSLLLVQEEPVVPAVLDRISWGAILAGTLIAFATELVFYLAGLTLGAAVIEPKRHDGPDVQTVTTGAVLWGAISTLFALFIGGWTAAHFAGIPTVLDGVLHGLMAWALLTLITVIGLVTGAGSIVSGTGTLISQIFTLLGSVTGAAATGAAGLAGALGGGDQQTIRVEMNGSAPTAAQQIVQTLGVAGAGMLGPDARQRLEEEYQKAIDRMPEVESAQDIVDMTLRTIEEQARSLAVTAGVSPQQARQQAQDQVEDLRSTAGQALRNPEDAVHMLRLAINRLVRRADTVTRDVDRDSLVHLLGEYTDMGEQEARETVSNWESAYQTAVDEMEQARERAWHTIQQARDAAEERLIELRDEAEARARQVASDATDSLAKLAAGLLLAMVIGAFAAGIGGSIGTPEELPAIELSSESTTQTHLYHT
ncbi:MAG: hypothetical protein ACFB51_09325 [Anaerolineae bacterium]